MRRAPFRPPISPARRSLSMTVYHRRKHVRGGAQAVARDAQPAQIVIAVLAAPESTWPGVRRPQTTLCARPCRPRSWPSVSRFGTSGRSPTRRSAGSRSPFDRWAVAAPGPVASTAADVLGAESRSTPPGCVPTHEVLAELVGGARIVLDRRKLARHTRVLPARAAMTQWLIEEKGLR